MLSSAFCSLDLPLGFLHDSLTPWYRSDWCRLNLSVRFLTMGTWEGMVYTESRGEVEGEGRGGFEVERKSHRQRTGAEGEIKVSA